MQEHRRDEMLLQRAMAGGLFFWPLGCAARRVAPEKSESTPAKRLPSVVPIANALLIRIFVPHVVNTCSAPNAGAYIYDEGHRQRRRSAHVSGGVRVAFGLNAS